MEHGTTKLPCASCAALRLELDGLKTTQHTDKASTTDKALTLSRRDTQQPDACPPGQDACTSGQDTATSGQDTATSGQDTAASCEGGTSVLDVTAAQDSATSAQDVVMASEEQLLLESCSVGWAGTDTATSGQATITSGQDTATSDQTATTSGQDTATSDQTTSDEETKRRRDERISELEKEVLALRAQLAATSATAEVQPHANPNDHGNN